MGGLWRVLTDKQKCSKYTLRRTLWMQNGESLGRGVGGRGRVDVGRGVRAVLAQSAREVSDTWPWIGRGDRENWNRE